MSLLIKIAVAGISLSGLLAGIALSRIAPEEFRQGKRFFVLFRRLLFAALSLAIILQLYQNSRFFLIPAAAAISIGLFFADLKAKISKNISCLLQYIFFLIFYFMLPDAIVVAALLFLYGFPAGTLLSVKHE